MKGEELTKRSIKSVTDEFKYLLNHNPQQDIDYFNMAKTSS